MTRPRLRFASSLVVLVLAAALFAAPAWAQAHNPFSVGISEGGGAGTGFTGWLLSQQGQFERSIAAAVRASKADGSAFWFLMGLSFVYGVLHAAGPGHGKAVLASYMVANERALRRGIALSFLAAILQALVAIALVALLSLVLHATALGMRGAATAIEKTSYLAITLLGAVLVWRKVRAFRQALATERPARTVPAYGLVLAGAGYGGTDGLFRSEDAANGARFVCEAAHEHGPGCGHAHGPDPSTLGDTFSWRGSIGTVVAAGARPCSGAILVLVFALAQGMFFAGIASTLVMALGTAITTAALASVAVLAKSIALRVTGPGSGRGALVARGFEVAAAALVLAVGVSLLLGLGPLQALS